MHDAGMCSKHGTSFFCRGSISMVCLDGLLTLISGGMFTDVLRHGRIRTRRPAPITVDYYGVFTGCYYCDTRHADLVQLPVLPTSVRIAFPTVERREAECALPLNHKGHAFSLQKIAQCSTISAK